VDDQISELITLAGGSPDKPATLNIPSAATCKRHATTRQLPAGAQGGGDAGKVMWLASCA